MHIFVSSPTGKKICLKVQPSDTLHDVKAKILKQHRLVLDGNQLDDNLTLADYDIQGQSTLDFQEKMQIYVIETLVGMNITLEVDSLDTIATLKAMIEDNMGFPKALQCLIFGKKQLKDNATLADHNICNESTLLLVLHPLSEGAMQIFVKTQIGRILTLKVDSAETIDNVKMKIYEKDGRTPTDQSIIFAGIVLEDGRTLADYKINDGCTIRVVARLSGS